MDKGTLKHTPNALRLDILIVEDEVEIATPIAEVLAEEGHRVTVEHDGDEALSRLQGHVFDVLISDIRLPNVDGLTLFDWVRRHATQTAVILMSAHGTIPEAVDALRHNALHYLRKPFELDELLDTVEQLSERRTIESSPPVAPEASGPIERMVVGSCPSIVGVKRRLAAIAASDAPVLIRGETGTGKEVVARAIHEASDRANGPFVAINCGALPETLMESELFGHERGAFTGAIKQRKGMIAAAEGGTLFLDEVTEMTPSCQVKLLRVLQEGMVQSLGSNQVQSVDARILAATNGDVRALMKAGRFREDLYYRLRVLDIHLPPLRERRGDLPVLVAHFLDRLGVSADDRARLSPCAWAVLRQYPFPGNVRELEHAVHHALVLSGQGTIESRHLPEEIAGREATDWSSIGLDRPQLGEALAAFEQEFITRTLDEVDWNKTRAAEVLGISRKNLWEKLKRHGIKDPPSR